MTETTFRYSHKQQYAPFARFPAWRAKPWPLGVSPAIGFVTLIAVALWPYAWGFDAGRPIGAIAILGAIIMAGIFKIFLPAILNKGPLAAVMRCTVRIEPRRLTILLPRCGASLPWSQVGEVIEGAGWLRIFSSDTAAPPLLCVPYHAFESEAARSAFVARLSAAKSAGLAHADAHDDFPANDDLLSHIKSDVKQSEDPTDPQAVATGAAPGRRQRIRLAIAWLLVLFAIYVGAFALNVEDGLSSGRAATPASVTHLMLTQINAVLHGQITFHPKNDRLR